MHDRIHRRDFLNGVLVAACGAAVGALSPLSAFAGSGGARPTTTLDPRMSRGGNLPAAFLVAHWLRDGRLSFPSPGRIAVAAGEDDVLGTFDVDRDGEGHDAIIVGSGIAGLSTAFYLSRLRPSARLLVLEANGAVGGNAGRDDASPLPVPTATGGAYAVEPYADFLKELYRAVGIDWTRHVVADPVYSYYFDDRTPHALRGARGWTLDVYGKGLESMPYPKEVIADLVKVREELRGWYDRAGAPTDPPDASDPKFDFLAVKSLEQHLRDAKHHPAVSDFYTRFSIDALAGTAEQVSAHAAISFLGAEYHPVFAMPGGTNGIVRHLIRWLIPGALPGKTSTEWLTSPISEAALDRPGNRVRVRQGAVVLRADASRREASVVYHRDGKFHRARAKAVVLAGQGHTGWRVADHLLSEPARRAWQQFARVPVVVANVALRTAAPLVKLGLGYNQYWWGSRYWADFTIADWCSPDRAKAERETVLTFYGGNWQPPEELAAERLKLLATPFFDYEASLREDLGRILGPGGFDFTRDVTSVFVYRWGHGMILPKPGFAFGAPVTRGGSVTRTEAPRHLARKTLGRIAFAGQDVEGTPSVESAIASGKRAAGEVVPVL